MLNEILRKTAKIKNKTDGGKTFLYRGILDVMEREGDIKYQLKTVAYCDVFFFPFRLLEDTENS